MNSRHQSPRWNSHKADGHEADAHKTDGHEKSGRASTYLRRTGLLRAAAISGISLALMLHPPLKAKQETQDDIIAHISPRDGEFTVQIGGNAGLTVECGPDGRIKLNGADVQPNPVNCDFLKFFHIIGGDGPNNINLSGMTANGFPNIQTIDIDGREGNDNIFGSIFNDGIRGGPGNDTLIGFFGDDSVFGELDDDLFFIDPVPGNDLSDGGPGLDHLIFFGDAGNDMLQLTRVGGLRLIRNSPIPFSLEIAAMELLEIDGGLGDDNLTVESLGSTGLTKLILNGNIGNDFFDLSQGDIPIFAFGGPGNDTILGGSASDSISGDDGNDSISGNGGADTVLGGADNDSISGGDDDDLIIWNNGDGSDVIDGDAGTDTQQVNGSANDDIVEIFPGTPPRVQVNITTNSPEPFGLSVGSVEVGVINVVAGNDIVSAEKFFGSLGMRYHMNGGLGNDQLIGGPDADTLEGGPGNDTLSGKDGGDLLIWNFGDGNDQHDGGDGKDRQEFFDSDVSSTLFITTTAPINMDNHWIPDVHIDSINIEETAVDLKGGDDSVQVNYADGFSVAQMLLEIRGGEGQDSVTALLSAIDDSLIIQTQNGATRITGENQPASTLDLYLPTELLDVRTNGGNDKITIRSLQPDLDLKIDGGEGNDTLKDQINFNLSPNSLFYEGGPGDDMLTTGDFAGRGSGRQTQAAGVTLRGGEGSDSYTLFFGRLPATTSVTDDGITGTDSVTVDAQGAVVTEAEGSVSAPGKTVTISGAENVSVIQKGTAVVHMPAISR